MVAKPQSMVLMKKTAKALAPAGVCWVAASGMIGGFSPGRVFGPVVGTSAGMLGPGAGEVAGGGVVAGADRTLAVGAGAAPDVQAETASTARAAIPPIWQRTSHMIRGDPPVGNGPKHAVEKWVQPACRRARLVW